ncbi:MAG TPA: DUF2336 domain-containing protein [Candidatus Omnitrophota bacterium]|nr:DUF2336 domain-containing protein [Candidatus Omnitrophota bacterium]
MVVGLLAKLFKGRTRPIGYEEARELAAHKDPALRAELAARDDIRPEILYFLAEDTSTEVRRRVAANPNSPPHADLMLAGDQDPAVRSDLAGKIARVAPGLTANEQDRLRRMTYEALEMLARDQIPKIRAILSDTLKDVANAPPEVIRRLARDAEIAVAAPVLQFSPVLTDEDLLEIIESSPIPGALSAISKRSLVNVRVADAIAATDDVDAIAVLLGNSSAQIREETLDRLADRAADIEAWHGPLVNRPHLPSKTATKLARFVASNLLQQLAERKDLPPDAAMAVAAVVRKRLDEMEATGPARAEARKAADETAAVMRAKTMHAAGQLNESAVDAALSGGDHPFVTAALALMAQLSQPTLKKIVATQSAKGIVAVAWKAGLSPELSVHLQTKLLRLTSSRVLHPRGGAYPLTVEEMEWQLEFLGD